jgi:hypothetical protein
MISTRGGGEVRVRINRHPLKRYDPADRDEARQHDHQKPLSQGRLNDSMDHLLGKVLALHAGQVMSAGLL